MAFISIGVTLLLTPFAFMYSLAGFIVFPSGWRKYFPFYIITISVLAYSYNPVGRPDILLCLMIAVVYPSKKLSIIFMMD